MAWPKHSFSGVNVRQATALLLLCCVVLHAELARTQPSQAPSNPDPVPAPAPPDASPPTLIPPQAISPTDVQYPDGESGTHEVILFLVIDSDGTVRSASLDSGDEPFATAARTAALNWRFRPATRDGEPTEAKIRFLVRFEEELVVAPTPESEAAPEVYDDEGAGPKPAPKPTVQPLEVTVEGVKLAPSVSSLTRAEVRQLPGAFGDPFRAIEILPGVTPIVSGLPFFYVRGAPPGNVGYFLDGVRVPYLFHVAAGPSVVHPALVDRVDLYSGGYPAQYGRYAGAIISAETTAPQPEWHGEGVVRLVDAGALVEGGFDGGKGTALVGGRYSYTALVISLISPEITLDYRDYQARITYDVAPRQRVTLFAFGSYDFLAQEVNGIDNTLFGAEFYRVDARHDYLLPGGGRLRTAATWGFDQTKVADGRNTRDMLGGTRLELIKPLDEEENLTLRTGFDVQIDNYEADARPYADPDDPDTQGFNDLFPPRIDGAAGAYIDVVWKMTPFFEVTPGVRVDTFRSDGVSAVSVDPRLAIWADVADGIRMFHALGTAHQPPSFVVPVPGLAVASLQGGLQRSLQASAGIEAKLPWDFTGTFTVFDNVFLNMTDTIGVANDGNADSQLPRSLGSGKGIEIYLRRSLAKRVGGFVSYTFSQSTRTIDGITFPTAFDRTHVLNTAASYDFGRGWRTGARVALYSGSPNLSPPPGAAFFFRPDNPPRDPLFYRLDLRLEKKWRIANTGWISAVMEMLNATLNTETINGQEAGPVSIPSIGVEGGF